MDRGREDIGQILQSSLESILAGKDTLDSILAKYPDLADRLRPELEMALWLDKLKVGFDPRPGHIADARQRLVARIQRESPRQASQVSTIKPAAASPQVLGRSQNGRQSSATQRRLAFQFAAVLIAVISLSLFSSGVVLAAQSSVPGDPFYPVKIVQEQIQVAASLSPVGDARLHIRFAERRLSELQALILENRYGFIPETVERYEEHLIQAASALDETAGQDLEQAKELSADLQEMVQSQSPVLLALGQAAPEQVRLSISQALEISEEAVQAAQEILEEAEQGTAEASSTPSPTSTPTPGGLPAPTGSAAPGTSLAPLGSPAASDTPAATPTSPGSMGPVPTGTATSSVTPPLEDTQEPPGEPASGSTPEARPTNTPKPEKSKTPPGLDRTDPPPPDTPPGQDKTRQPPPNPPPDTPPGQEKTREPPPNPPPDSPPGQAKTGEPPPNPPPDSPPGQANTKEPPPGQAKKTPEPTP